MEPWEAGRIANKLLLLVLVSGGACKDERPRITVPLEAPATAIGVGWTSAEDIRGFTQRCGAAQTGRAEVGASDIRGYGSVYRGEGPVPGRNDPPADGVFRWVEKNPEYLDPNLISDSTSQQIAIQMFEPLLVPAAGNRDPLPGAAERYTVSEDGRTWTFHLRRGLVWSDGRPLGARDFRYAWLRALDPATGSKNAQQLWAYIDGAKAYNEGRSRDASRVGIEVVDDHTLRVRLLAPVGYFHHLVTYIAYAPVPRHAIEAHGDAWTRPENMVVNGPYALERYTPRDRIVLAKNPRYWDAANVAIERSEVLLSDSEETNVRLYEAREVHLARPLPPGQVRRYIAAKRGDLRIDQHMCSYYYSLGLERAPFDEPLVRRAFARAIDRTRLVRHVLGRRESVATHLVPDLFEATLGFRATPGEGFDPEAARRLLAEAGYPRGVGLPEIELRYNTSEVHREVAEFVQRNLHENLGVRVKLHNYEWKTMLGLLRRGDFTLARSTWCADYPDPVAFLEVFRSGAPTNYVRYANPAYDALVSEVKQERDPKRRNRLICAAEETLNRDLPVIPLFFYTDAYLIRPFVKGYEPQYLNIHLLKYLSLGR